MNDLPPTSWHDWYVLAWQRRTTLLGYLVIALGILAASDSFSPGVAKWLVLANGIVTAALGHFNHATLQEPK